MTIYDTMKRFFVLALATMMLAAGCSDDSKDPDAENGEPNQGQEQNQNQNQEQNQGQGQEQQGQAQQGQGQGQSGTDETCNGGEEYCNGECLDLGLLHLANCDACADNYCDADENLTNGCEIYTKGSDDDNCGSCGHGCETGEFCERGICAQPGTLRMVIVSSNDNLNVRSAPEMGNNIIGSLPKYSYVRVIEEADGWVKHNYEGQDGWSSANYLMDVCETCEGRAAVEYAEQFLYDNNTRICTWDHLTYEPIIENFTDLGTYNDTYNYGYDNNCANFVTACLKSVGLISKNLIAVAKVIEHCKAGTDGYHEIEFEDAKAGDIWVMTGNHHTELVVGYKDDTLYLIGSNNFGKTTVNTEEDHVCQIHTEQDVTDYQRVWYDSAKKSGTSIVCSRR